MSSNKKPSLVSFNKILEENLQVGENNKGRKVKTLPWNVNQTKWNEISQEEKMCSIIENNEEKIMDTLKITPNESCPKLQEIYETLKNKAIDVYEELKNTKKTKPLVGCIKIVCEKENINWKQLKRMKIKHESTDKNVILFVHMLLDTGTESNFLSKGILKTFEPEKIECKVQVIKQSDGTTRKVKDLYKIKIMDNEKRIINTSARSFASLGEEKQDNESYIQSVKRELNITEERQTEFNLFQEDFILHGIIGLKIGDLMPTQVSPEDIGLKREETSPNLVLFTTPLCEKYLVAGSPGINPENCDHDYPTFTIPNPGDKSEKNSKRIFFVKESENENYTSKKEMEKQNQKVKLKDTIKDLKISKKLAEESSEIVGFTKNDSKLLQNFLEEESKGKEYIRKCNLHKLECSNCIILNKTNSEEEDKIISDLWDNQTLIEESDGSQRILQKFQYRNPIEKTFNPENSNKKAAGKQTKNLLKRAKLVGALETLVEQVNDAVKDGVLVI